MKDHYEENVIPGYADALGRVAGERDDAIQALAKLRARLDRKDDDAPTR